MARTDGAELDPTTLQWRPPTCRCRAPGGPAVLIDYAGVPRSRRHYVAVEVYGALSAIREALAVAKVWSHTSGGSGSGRTSTSGLARVADNTWGMCFCRPLGRM